MHLSLLWAMALPQLAKAGVEPWRKTFLPLQDLYSICSLRSGECWAYLSEVLHTSTNQPIVTVGGSVPPRAGAGGSPSLTAGYGLTRRLAYHSICVGARP